MDVQVQIGPGLPAFAVVGLPDKAVAESRERVRGVRPGHQSTPGEWLCLGHARLHEVEGVAVEDCGVDRQEQVGITVFGLR